MQKYTDNSAYRAFILKRDKALESILQNTQKDFSRLLHPYLINILEQCAALHIQFDKTTYNPNVIKRSEKYIRSRLEPIQNELESKLKDRYLLMRKAVYVLSVYGEYEALKQVKDLDSIDFNLDKNEIEKDVTTKDFLIYLSENLDGITDKAIKAFTNSLIDWDDKKETLSKVVKAFPRPTVFRKKKTVAKVTEAKKNFEQPASITFMPEDEWDQVIKQYKDALLPKTRFFNDEIIDAVSEDQKYAWQIEKQLTQAFIGDIAKATTDAGEQAGVKDFVWIAILDEKTCDHCCRPRDGMTLSEIEKALADGKLDSDHCDATVPPAHFNCRCRLVPIDTDIPKRDAKGVEDFEKWLGI